MASHHLSVNVAKHFRKTIHVTLTKLLPDRQSCENNNISTKHFFIEKTVIGAYTVVKADNISPKRLIRQ